MSGSTNESWQQMVVSRAPDQVRSECDGSECSGSVGIEHVGFSDGLGAGVVAKKRPGQWLGFVGIDHVVAVEDDTGA